MRTRDFVLTGMVAFGCLLVAGPFELRTQAQSSVVLTGQVSSAEEGTMEGVVVSAKKDGATITVSVVTDAQGRFAFPAERLEPGHYTLKARAAGYDLDGTNAADVAAGREARTDLKLKKTRNLPGQMTNAEWLISMPGTDEHKKFLLNCIGCHTLERIVKSTHDAEEFLQVFDRMSTYYPGSTPTKPQRLAGDARRDRDRGPEVRKIAEWLATVNLSQQDTWDWPLKTMPRLTGKSTRVVITEYDLPDRAIQPHDVMLDHEGNVWYTDFGQLFLGKMDPKSGKVTQYPVPETKKGWPVGSLNLEVDKDDNIWLGVMYQGSIAKFDKKTEKFQTWSIPKEWDTDAGQLGHLAVEGTKVDNKVWIKNSDGTNIYRLDLDIQQDGESRCAEGSAQRQADRYLWAAFRCRKQHLSARLLGRQHCQDRRQDQGPHGLSDADAELPSASRSHRCRRSAVVRRISRQRHRYVRSEICPHPGMEGADAVERAL